MLKVVRVSSVRPIERLACDQSKDKQFRCETVEDVIFCQGRIAAGMMKLVQATRRR